MCRRCWEIISSLGTLGPVKCAARDRGGKKTSHLQRRQGRRKGRKMKNNERSRSCGSGTASQREVRTEPRLTVQETCWTQTSHPRCCREGRRATTARVAKALECDAGALHCSVTASGNKQDPDTKTVGRQFSLYFHCAGHNHSSKTVSKTDTDTETQLIH